MDEDLVRRAALGDADAFDALGRDRIDRLFGIAIRILRDHHDAEDAVQQALWSAWTDLPSLRDPSRFDAWLYRLLLRACYGAARSRRRRASIVRIEPDLERLPDRVDSDLIADRDALDRAFAALSTEQRAVVVLHHFLDMGLDEIAEVVGVPAGTARSRLHYALRRLRAELDAANRPPAAAAGSDR